MALARSAGKALKNLVTRELECFDRLPPDACVPLQQTGAGADWFFREIRGNPVPVGAGDALDPALNGMPGTVRPGPGR